MIILDTDILIEIFDKKSALGEEILGKIEGYDIATTTINLHEIIYGFYKVEKEVVKELMVFNILDYTRSDALLSAKLEVKLEKVGSEKGDEKVQLWKELQRVQERINGKVEGTYAGR